MNTLIFILGIVSGVIQISGYVVYTENVLRNEVRPNSASWSIWAFGSILNFVSYAQLTHEWAKEFLPAVCAMSCIICFLIACVRGSLGRLDKGDWCILVLDCIAVLVWWMTESSLYGNVLLQISTAISYIPVVRQVYATPSSEKPLAWYLWALAYGILLVVVILDWKHWGEMVYPLVGSVSCLGIALLTQRRHKTSSFG